MTAKNSSQYYQLERFYDGTIPDQERLICRFGNEYAVSTSTRSNYIASLERLCKEELQAIWMHRRLKSNHEISAWSSCHARLCFYRALALGCAPEAS
jgi:hypothetical protein